MKVIMKWKRKGDKDSEIWDEEIELDGVYDFKDARQAAQKLIDSFNDTLRPHEKARVLLDVVVVEGTKGAREKHDWEKRSLVTESGMYDRMECKVCGITAKRHGLGSEPIRDPKYKDEVYARCDTAFAHLRRKERAGQQRERKAAKRREHERRTKKR